MTSLNKRRKMKRRAMRGLRKESSSLPRLSRVVAAAGSNPSVYGLVNCCSPRLLDYEGTIFILLPRSGDTCIFGPDMHNSTTVRKEALLTDEIRQYDDFSDDGSNCNLQQSGPHHYIILSSVAWHN
jgi:hypothetical protein